MEKTRAAPWRTPFTVVVVAFVAAVALWLTVSAALASGGSGGRGHPEPGQGSGGSSFLPVQEEAPNDERRDRGDCPDKNRGGSGSGGEETVV